MQQAFAEAFQCPFRGDIGTGRWQAEKSSARTDDQDCATTARSHFRQHGSHYRIKRLHTLCYRPYDHG